MVLLHHRWACGKNGQRFADEKIWLEIRRVFFGVRQGIDFNAAIHLEPFNVQVWAGVDNKSDMIVNGDE